MNSLDAFWGKLGIAKLEKQVMNKKEAKNTLKFALFNIRHSSARHFEVTIIIKELTP
jgi:hypothetical protein